MQDDLLLNHSATVHEYRANETLVRLSHSEFLPSSLANSSWLADATLSSTSPSSPSSPSSSSSARYTIVESVFIGLVLSALICFSIAGNLLVVVAIVTDRYLRKVSNYFIISLAIADLLLAVLVMSFAVVNDILGHWVFGAVFCNIWISFDVMCCTASILNLCAVSLDRYIHIRSPLHYERWMTPRKTLVGIASIWVVSALISFVPIHLGWHQSSLSSHGGGEDTERRAGNWTSATPPEYAYAYASAPTTTAGDDYSQQTIPVTGGSSSSNGTDLYICMLQLSPLYAVMSSMVSFYIPCIVMILIYFKMYQYARRHVKSIKTLAAAGGSTNNNPHGGGRGKHHQYKLSDHKAAITLGVIMGTFLFCWVPFFTINIIGAFCPTCIPPIVFSVFIWLGYLNSTMNPVIYSIFNAEFREAFKRVLSSMKWCCRRDSDRDFGKPIRANGSSPSIEYGALTSRKISRSQLVSQRITTV